MQAFPPLVAENPVVLVLGSMPSQLSLEKNEYYAHPRNAFWWLMASILKFDVEQCYATRVERLTSSGIAVWDVLRECERPGSLDSSIQRTTEVANSFTPFFGLHSSIKLIAFNGGAAKHIFMRHCSEVLEQTPGMRWSQLPSTSPAHAAMTKEQKYRIWSHTLSNFLPS